jgi:hypothetical protein
MDRTGFADFTGIGASATATERFFRASTRFDSKKALLAQVLTTYLRSPRDALAAVDAIWRHYREPVHNSIAVFELVRSEILADHFCRLVQMGQFQATQNSVRPIYSNFECIRQRTRCGLPAHINIPRCLCWTKGASRFTLLAYPQFFRIHPRRPQLIPPRVVDPWDPPRMLHEDDILNEARAHIVPNDKNIIRSDTDSCKSDDDDQLPAFFGGQVTFGQQARSMECALSDFSTTFIGPVPQHRLQIQVEGPIYVPTVPLKKTKPRSLKASV